MMKFYVEKSTGKVSLAPNDYSSIGSLTIKRGIRSIALLFHDAGVIAKFADGYIIGVVFKPSGAYTQATLEAGIIGFVAPATDADPYTADLNVNTTDIETALAGGASTTAMMEIVWRPDVDSPWQRSDTIPVTIRNFVYNGDEAPATNVYVPDGDLYIDTLPTVDPHVRGRHWLNGGAISLSLG